MHISLLPLPALYADARKRNELLRTFSSRYNVNGDALLHGSATFQFHDRSASAFGVLSVGRKSESKGCFTPRTFFMFERGSN